MLDQKELLKEKRWSRSHFLPESVEINMTLQEAARSVPFSRVGELGCRDAKLLIDFALEDWSFKGVGIEWNSKELELAKENVERSGLGDRIEVHECDIWTDDQIDRSFHAIETVMSFMVLHQFFKDQRSTDNGLLRLREIFPNASYFLLGDVLDIQNETTRFLSGYKLFGVKHYLDVFQTAGLRFEKIIPFGAPNTFLFLLTAN